MKVKNFFVAGFVVVAIFMAGTTVGFASDKDICSKQIDKYLLMKMNDGLLPGDEFNPYDFKAHVANRYVFYLCINWDKYEFPDVCGK